MAASVGPYRLCNSAPQPAKKRRSSFSDSTSPLQNTCRRLAHWSSPPSSNNTCNSDGTKCTVVTCCVLIVSTSHAPVSKGQKNSHTDTSKLNAVFCNTASPLPRSYCCCIHNSRLRTAPCWFIAPFGWPVEPEV